MRIQELKANDKNPRTVTDKKLAQLKKALIEFGDLSGIVFNRKTKSLVGGHQRCKLFRADDPITITRKYSKPTRTGTVAEGFIELQGARFSYREVMWDKARETAAMIAANKNAGVWDEPQLGELLKELSSFDADFDLDLTMFDADELTEFAGITVAEHTRKGVTGVDEDAVPEKAPAVSKPGDTYKLGQHRLMCGDSTSIDAVDKLMNGEKADMVFTDPPYGMFLDTDFSSMDGLSPSGKSFLGTKGGKVHKQVAGDHEDFNPEFINTVFAAFPDCEEVFLWGADYYAELLPNRNDGSWVVWDKRTNDGASEEQANSADRLFGSNFELCWSKSRHKRELARVRNGIFGVKNESGNSKTVHPTQKPVQLAEWFFGRWGKPGDNLVDLFGGSGSTLIACEKTNRKCFMMEIDPHYCDVIVARWEKYTGKTAERIPAPKTKLVKKAVKQPISTHA